MDYHKEARANLKLDDDADVDDWIYEWDGDEYTQKNFKLTVACEEEPPEMGLSLGLIIPAAIILLIVLCCVSCCICNCVIVSQKRNKWCSAAKLVETPLGTIEYSMKG